MKNIMKRLDGNKTNIVAGAMIVYAMLGYALGQLGESEATLTVFNALGLMGLRHGVAKSTKK